MRELLCWVVVVNEGFGIDRGADGSPLKKTKKKTKKKRLYIMRYREGFVGCTCTST